MSKHTPGPWTLRPYNNGAYIYDNNGEEVTFTDSLELAHLIAAAPELLEYLKAFVHLEEMDSPLKQNALAAIAKAEGRTNETGN